MDKHYLHAEALGLDMQAVHKLQQQGYLVDTGSQLEWVEESAANDGKVDTVWVLGKSAEFDLEVLEEPAALEQPAGPEQLAGLEELSAPVG